MCRLACFLRSLFRSLSYSLSFVCACEWGNRSAMGDERETFKTMINISMFLFRAFSTSNGSNKNKDSIRILTVFKNKHIAIVVYIMQYFSLSHTYRTNVAATKKELSHSCLFALLAVCIQTDLKCGCMRACECSEERRKNKSLKHS